MIGDDAANLIGLGIGGLVLMLAIRLLTRQSDSWSGVLDAVKADAAAAREEAARLRATESECHRQVAALWQEIDRLEAELARLRNREDN